jgi:hypothetical protein
MPKPKKELETIIIKGPKPRRFDLSMKRPNENVKILAAIESLKQNAGWHFLVQVFNENIKVLSEQIISKQDEYGKPLNDAQIDELRMKYSYLKELLEKPDSFVKTLSRTDEGTPNLDPYDDGRVRPPRT